MRRAHFDPLLVGSIHPSAENTSAREDKRMLAIVVDDGKIKIAIEGCGRDRLPYAAIHARIADGVFDLDQSALKGPVVPDSRSASIEGWVPI